MFRSATLLAAAALMSASAHAASLDVPSGTYALDRSHASLVWKVSHLGLSSYTAQFATLDGTIELDAEDVANSKVTATVDPSSVVTLHPFPEEEDFDAKLANDWFKSGEFPEATFTSTSIEVTGENTARMTGDLTFMGQTNPVTFDVTLNAAQQHPANGKPVLGISATGTFDRTAYGLNNLAGPIGADVTLVIEGEFIAQ